MSQVIRGELFFCLFMASAGVLILFGYDLLRILRRVFPHGSFLVAAEDFLYWSIAGILAFGVIFLKNSGVVRGFSLCALGMGMALYHKSASRPFVRVASASLCFLRNAFRRIGRFLWKPVSYFAERVCKKPKKALKNVEKCVKLIAIRKGMRKMNKEGSFYGEKKKGEKTL